MKLISLSRRNLLREGRAGFTLVEMLIAVLILGILLGIALPMYLSSQNSTEESACQSSMSAIFQAEEAYRVRSQTRSYTTNMADLSASMASLPVCPEGTAAYTITTTGSGSSMTLTISCPNRGAHVSGKTMATTDGQTFTFQ